MIGSNWIKWKKKVNLSKIIRLKEVITASIQKNTQCAMEGREPERLMTSDFALLKFISRQWIE